MSVIHLFKKAAVIATALVFVFTLQGCPYIDPDHDYEFEYEIIITDVPANLEGFNSQYNDYNSALPFEANRREIYFSTDRKTNGSTYDIISHAFDISYHKRDDVLNISIPVNPGESIMDRKLLPLINTGYDELGPYTYFEDGGLNYFFYAGNGSDEQEEPGDYDIKFVYMPRSDWTTYGGQQRLFGPYDVSLANSEADDLYPVISDKLGKMLFCSNRENDSFDIYSLELEQGALLNQFLTGNYEPVIAKEPALSGEGHDKCPSIFGDYVIFASDREGGYGGFDLYYAKYENNAWSEPVNFGDKINTASNEYRPLGFKFVDFSLMIFSSDRPGGKGGFDLYCVDVSEIIEVHDWYRFYEF
ncbi:MAG TPA: hypothetical protein PLR34_07015 [Bacteroidales bacterium]|jgi:hypothetical protein|nr:hypothetical protein [Burkholderiales bacterium]HQM98894.1 hypothetical protein [Bacteroidales bacterium]HQQ81302.1 hypothetical protein [Bacteroidales bacterium]